MPPALLASVPSSLILPLVERIESVAQPTIKEEFFNGIGSVPSFRTQSSKDRFKQENVRAPDYAAESLEISVLRQQYSAEEKIRIVLAGLRGEEIRGIIHHRSERRRACDM
jgi:hypothetical protein